MLSQRRVWFALVCILASLLVLSVTSAGAAGVAKPAGALPKQTEELPQCTLPFAFAQKNFTNPTRIDNRWMPLTPGTQFTLEGTTSEGSHRVVLTVTDLKKVVNGVPTVVMWDRDFQDDQLVESELTFQAQDKSGNVWLLGEYPEEFEEGKFVGAPSTWIGGVQGAKAGIAMMADPQVGKDPYLQGQSLKVDFWDCGQVYQKGQTVKVPYHNTTYNNVLVVDEWAPLDQAGGTQQKFYAQGVGNVQVGAKGDPNAEVLQMTNLSHLDKKALADARKEALKLDWHAYLVSSVYRQTLPAW